MGLARLGADPAPRVTVIEDVAWSPDDASRDGAAELEILMHVAQLQKSPGAIGIVGIGDAHAVFQAGTHRALELAVREGIPVVRLALLERSPAVSDTAVFIDGGTLDPAAATALLTQCLREFGPLPRTAFTTSPPAELRRHLARFQTVFDRAQLRAQLSRVEFE